jgi:hypothetical protein
MRLAKEFHRNIRPPFAVINDFALLASLSPRDKRAGYVKQSKSLDPRREFLRRIERDALSPQLRLDRRSASSTDARNCT